MITVCIDRRGVKRIAPTYFNYRIIRNKKKDTDTAKIKHKQETMKYEHTYKYK